MGSVSAMPTSCSHSLSNLFHSSLFGTRRRLPYPCSSPSSPPFSPRFLDFAPLRPPFEFPNPPLAPVEDLPVPLIKPLTVLSAGAAIEGD